MTSFREEEIQKERLQELVGPVLVLDKQIYLTDNQFRKLIPGSIDGPLPIRLLSAIRSTQPSDTASDYVKANEDKVLFENLTRALCDIATATDGHLAQEIPISEDLEAAFHRHIETCERYPTTSTSDSEPSSGLVILGTKVKTVKE